MHKLTAYAMAKRGLTHDGDGLGPTPSRISILCYTILESTITYYNVLYYTTLHYSTLYYTLLYSTMLL